MKYSLGAVALLSAVSVNAIEFGDDVLPQNYQDFVVRLATTSGDYTSRCGGALIGSSYLLTARHCLDLTHTGADYKGQTGSILIQQDVNTSADGVNVNYTVLLDGNDSAFINQWVSQAQDHFDNTIFPADPVMSAHVIDASYLAGDWALLQLNSPMEHSSSAILSPLYDMNSHTSYLPAVSTLTFQGWGKDESGSNPSTMQSTSMKIFTQWEKAETGMSVSTGDFPYFDADVGHNVPTVCTTSDPLTVLCSWDGTDRFLAWGYGNSNVAVGDSGTPLVSNNRILGIAVNESSDGSYDRFQHFTLVLDLMGSAINKLTYPSASKTVAVNSTAQQTFKLAVQNFTASAETLNPMLTDATGLFSADVSDCTGQLDSLQGCMITVTFNAAGSSITDTKVAQIDLNGADVINLKIEAKNISTGGSTDGGSGGSFGFLSLLALMGLGLRRVRS